MDLDFVLHLILDLRFHLVLVLDLQLPLHIPILILAESNKQLDRDGLTRQNGKEPNRQEDANPSAYSTQYICISMQIMYVDFSFRDGCEQTPPMKK